jgi:hypothetical protein
MSNPHYTEPRKVPLALQRGLRVVRLALGHSQPPAETLVSKCHWHYAEARKVPLALRRGLHVVRLALWQKLRLMEDAPSETSGGAFPLLIATPEPLD